MSTRILRWFMSTRVYRWILLQVMPFVRFSTYYTKMKGHQFARGYSMLRSGDIILTTDKAKLTTLLVPGQWTHAAFCARKGDPLGAEICEMNHNGFEWIHFFDICKESDRVAILRPSNWSADYREWVIARAVELSGAEYDVRFSPDKETLYCSELVQKLDAEGRIIYRPQVIAGIPGVVTPDALWGSPTLDRIWDSGAAQ